MFVNGGDDLEWGAVLQVVRLGSTLPNVSEIFSNYRCVIGRRVAASSGRQFATGDAPHDMGAAFTHDSRSSHGRGHRRSRVVSSPAMCLASLG